MLFPLVGVMFILLIVVGGGLFAALQTGYHPYPTKEDRRPLDAPTFIVAMLFVAMATIILCPLIYTAIILR